MSRLITIVFIVITALFAFCVYSYVHASENNIVAKVIAAEACGEGEIGMWAVANVIANRSNLWGRTTLEIVSQRNQFYGYTAKHRNRLYNECKNIADRLANNIFELEDITKGALYFRQHNEDLYSWHGEQTVVIKNHIFHKESDR